MSRIVPRTCTEVPDDARDPEAGSQPLDVFRAEPAYVMLGDPGSGKTTAFERECEACGAEGLFVSARDFRTFDPASRPEWRGKTLFIDGLDEVRAGSSDARVPLDAIRRNLDTLGRPRFRLSCREADWLGTNDRTNLVAVAPDAHVTVLRLDPLTDSDIEEILESDPRIGDSRGCIREARERGVEGFLTNPQSLDMLARVVAHAGKWPADRLELFEDACRRIADEHSDEHRAAGRSSDRAPVRTGGSLLEDVLEAAGRLCAIQLIAGAAGYALTSSEESGDFPPSTGARRSGTPLARRVRAAQARPRCFASRSPPSCSQQSRTGASLRFTAISPSSWPPGTWRDSSRDEHQDAACPRNVSWP